ncbi:MAG: hypothetical protein HY078_05575 [Elusimicrobia bacterium]|nr:hypothetical protein [Elusimicrobiota bacterium]
MKSTLIAIVVSALTSTASLAAVVGEFEQTIVLSAEIKAGAENIRMATQQRRFSGDVMLGEGNQGQLILASYRGTLDPAFNVSTSANDCRVSTFYGTHRDDAFVGSVYCGDRFSFSENIISSPSNAPEFRRNAEQRLINEFKFSPSRPCVSDAKTDRSGGRTVTYYSTQCYYSR